MGQLIKDDPARKEEIENMQKEMSSHVFDVFAAIFRDNPVPAELGRVSAGHKKGAARRIWFGGNLDTMSSRNLEATLAAAVREDFKLRFGRIGLDYREPA